jgi:hypothetical protein
MRRSIKDVVVSYQVKLYPVFRWSQCCSCKNLFRFDLMHHVHLNPKDKAIGKLCRGCVNSKEEAYDFMFPMMPTPLQIIERNLRKTTEKLDLATEGLKNIIKTSIQQSGQSWNPETEKIVASVLIEAETTLRGIE